MLMECCVDVTYLCVHVYVTKNHSSHYVFLRSFIIEQTLCHLGHLSSHTNITHKFRLMRTYKHFYCSDALVHPKFNLLEWDCESECEYSCMWNTVSLFQQHGVKIPQFYGKVIILDIQPIVYCVIYSLGWAGIVNFHLPSFMNT